MNIVCTYLGTSIKDAMREEDELTKHQDIHSPGEDLDTTTITRYIHIKNSDSPVQIFKETTV
jgi:hypothetical protein